MPPSENLLAPSFRGYVCRSCLLRLSHKQKYRTLWPLRKVSNASPRLQSRRERVTSVKDESTFRLLEQDDDGTRTDISEVDREHDIILEELDATIQDLEAQTGKPSDALKKAREDEQDMEDISEEDFSIDPRKSFQRRANASVESVLVQAMASQSDNFEAHIRHLEKIPVFSKATSPHDSATVRQLTGIKLSRAIDRPALDKNSSPEIERSSVLQSSLVTLSSSTQFPVVYRPYIVALGKELQRATSILDHMNERGSKINGRNIRKSVWRHYMLSRMGLLTKPSFVPAEVWICLWDVMATSDPISPERMVRLHLIGDDMEKAGIELDPARRLLYIESCFAHGDHFHAIKDWEVAESTLVSTSGVAEEYWKLGVRMFCGTGQVDRALHAADSLLEVSDHPASYRILLPIIKAYVSQEPAPRLREAWALYVRFRVKIGTFIEMKDYDNVISTFLIAGQPQPALEVFKDMMLTGDSVIAEYDSIRLSKNVSGSDTDVDTTRSVRCEWKWEDSGTLANLPPKFNNKIFFGSWIKKLIGDGDLISAKKVLDMMQDRRICPSPIHVNGLIGAWFRTGTEKNRMLAEDLAWKMIRSRIEFVAARDALGKTGNSFLTITNNGKPDSRSVFLTPQATIETFTVLVQQYRRRQRPDLVSELFSALQKAHIPANTWFMNELLLMDTRAHSKGRVWKTYTSLKNVGSIKPNIETYAILWQNMKKQVDPVVGGRSGSTPSNFATCRVLFADMMQSAPGIIRKKTISRELYEMIVLCFSYDQDQAGTAVALLALRRYFDLFPSEATVRAIVLQLSRLGLVTEWGQKRRFDQNAGQNRERVASVTKVLQMFKEHRNKELQKHGMDFETLSGEERSEQTLLVLFDLLGYAHRMRTAEQGEGNSASQAAQDMGVPECLPWTQPADTYE